MPHGKHQRWTAKQRRFMFWRHRRIAKQHYEKARKAGRKG
jgi:hypothetical protein